MGFLANAQKKYINYKGLLSDNNGPMANANINVKVTISLHETIPFIQTIDLYEEEHTNVHTDEYGIFSIVIGRGQMTGGITTYNNIDWKTTPGINELRYDIAIDTGSGYQNFVTDEVFESVPYSNVSIYSKQAEFLAKQDRYIEFLNGDDIGLKFDIHVNNNYNYYLKNTTTDGFGFYYGSSMALKFEGADGIRIPGYLTVEDKLYGSDSGDADMKAYIYGYFNGQGTPYQNACSSGFAVNRLSTGRYRVAFANSPGSADNYIAIATSQGSLYNASTTQYDDYFEIYIRNIDTNSYADPPAVKFVVFKK